MTRTITADRIIVDNQSGHVRAEHALASAKACQVHLEIDPDGNVSDPTCDSVSCGGTCELKSEEQGTSTHYWCDCE